MASLENILEEYWVVALFILSVYIFLIIIIELNEMEKVNFNIFLYRHNYKEKDNWKRNNHLFIRDISFYQTMTIQQVILVLHEKFKKIILSRKGLESTLEESEVGKLFDSINNQQLKLFMHEPEEWLATTGIKGNLLSVQNFKKNRKTFHKLKPFLNVLEKALITEFRLNFIEQRLH